MNNNEKTNVVEIPVGGKRKKSSESQQPKALVINMISRHMLSGHVYELCPFPEKFIVSSPEPGTHLIYRQINDAKLVEKVNKSYVTDTIVRWASESWTTYPELLIDPRTAADVCRNWLGMAPKIPDVIKSFEFLDGDDYVTHRVPFTPDLESGYDHVDIRSQEWRDAFPYLEFLSRCSAPEQVAAFIGSIFYPESYMQQYLVIWGGGNDGKGSVVRALQKVLAGAFHADSFEFMGRFWTSAFIGKRLIVFPDNNDQKAMQSGIWKQLTGGDSVRVELKGEATFTAGLNAKYMITSNFAPVLKMDRADQRRAIVAHIDQISGPIDPAVEARMAEWDQLKFMVEYSCWVYRKLCVNGGHKPIPVESDQTDLIQNADEELEQRMLDKFRFGPLYVTPVNVIREILDRDFNGNKVARILTDRFGCVRFQAREGGKYSVKRIYYAGIGVGHWEGANEINERNLAAVRGLKVYEDAVAALPPEFGT